MPNYSNSRPLERDAQKLEAHASYSPDDLVVPIAINYSAMAFNFAVFAIASLLIFPTYFFHNIPYPIALICSLAIFSLDYVLRPLGTWLFFKIDPRHGHATRLSSTILLYGLASIGISVLPSTESIGAMAIVLLILFRAMQGLAIGGSNDSLMLLINKGLHKSDQNYARIIVNLGIPIGLFISSALYLYIYSAMSSIDFYNWGWRYPLYVNLVINVVTLFVRLRITLTKAFIKADQGNLFRPYPLPSSTHNWRILLQDSLATLSSYTLLSTTTLFYFTWILLHSEDYPIQRYLMVECIGGVLTFASICLTRQLYKQSKHKVFLWRLQTALFVYVMLFAGCAFFNISSNLINDSFILAGFVLLGLNTPSVLASVGLKYTGKTAYTLYSQSSNFSLFFGLACAPTLLFCITCTHYPQALSAVFIAIFLTSLVMLRKRSYL